MFELVWFIAIGAAAGWLARRIMHRPELNLVANMALGMLGAILGGLGLGLLGLHAGKFIGSLITATLRAVGLIWFVGRARAPD